MAQMIKILLLGVCFLKDFFSTPLLKNAKKLYGQAFISALNINCYANIHTLLYVSMYMYIYIYICIYICIYTFISMYVFINLSIYLSTYLSISVSLYICIYMILQCYKSSNSINVDILHCIYITTAFIFCIYTNAYYIL